MLVVIFVVFYLLLGGGCGCFSDLLAKCFKHLSSFSSFFPTEEALCRPNLIYNLELRRTEHTHTHENERARDAHTHSQTVNHRFFFCFNCFFPGLNSNSKGQCLVAKLTGELRKQNGLRLNIEYCYLVAKTHTERETTTTRLRRVRNWKWIHRIASRSGGGGLCERDNQRLGLPVCLPRLKRCASVCVCAAGKPVKSR